MPSVQLASYPVMSVPPLLLTETARMILPSPYSVEVMVGAGGSSRDTDGLTIPTATVSPFRGEPEDERTLVMSQL